MMLLFQIPSSMHATIFACYTLRLQRLCRITLLRVKKDLRVQHFQSTQRQTRFATLTAGNLTSFLSSSFPFFFRGWRRGHASLQLQSADSPGPSAGLSFLPRAAPAREARRGMRVRRAVPATHGQDKLVASAYSRLSCMQPAVLVGVARTIH